MAESVKVRTVEFPIRTVNLSKALLRQFRKLQTIPTEWLDGMEGDQQRIKPEHVVGWIHGSVLPDQDYPRLALLTNGNGDYFVHGYYQSQHGGAEKVFGKMRQIYLP